MVVIGSDDVYKISLCRILSGSNQFHFQVGTKAQKVDWRGDADFPVVLIDTPSLKSDDRADLCPFTKITELIQFIIHFEKNELIQFIIHFWKNELIHNSQFL